ncbi:kynurenine 3-monooxygenase [Trichomonascus vanleenenianus]|uniref:kynurenine 3-monooxygenase n=1 Tax=Trichomonascus vanleenenianus TaxID=2268995 RepID=UPI003ECB7511
MPEKTIAVVGAGLVGCLAALAFSKKGFKVRVYEARPDIRSPEQQEQSQFRSINLAVSSRGIVSLEQVDPEMAKRVLKDVIPMYGRMVHDMEGNQSSQNYGLYGEAINSIDRAELNRTMLDELEKSDNIELFFEHKLQFADLKKPSLTFSHGDKQVPVDDIDVVIGADGAFSKVRAQLQRIVRMDYSQQYIDHLYLELKVPAGENGTFLLDPNHLHIWPRHEFMLIALANGDGSFTSTLFAPQRIFEQLDSDDRIMEFFRTNFSDAVKVMGEKSILECFHNNPRGSLVSIKCNPYHYSDKVLIIGDAAHSMVPFYGQGMNCGFEDVRVLMSVLEATQYDFGAAFAKYTETRHQDLKAIIDLAMDNYVEMRHSVTSYTYLMRKKIDGLLSRVLKDAWLPLYTMVSFRPDIPYSSAIRRERQQKQIINGVLETVLRTVGTGVIFGAVYLGYLVKRRS